MLPEPRPAAATPGTPVLEPLRSASMSRVRWAYGALLLRNRLGWTSRFSSALASLST